MYAISKSFHTANPLRKQIITFLPVHSMSKEPGEAAL